MAKKLHQLATLYVDQYGNRIRAGSLKELKFKAGPGSVAKMYVDVGNEVMHCGYCIGDRWFNAYAPVLVREVPEQRSEKEQDRLDMRKACRLVKKHPDAEIAIDRDTGPGPGWWVYSKYTDEPGNPIEGNAFCTSGREVLEAVEAVLAHHKAQ